MNLEIIEKIGKLSVEAVPPGYPTVFNFLPDIDTFYEKWLGKRAPDK